MKPRYLLKNNAGLAIRHRIEHLEDCQPVTTAAIKKSTGAVRAALKAVLLMRTAEIDFLKSLLDEE